MPGLTQQKIKEYLLSRDRRLKTLLDNVPFPKQRGTQDIYTALIASIVSQQLSVKAADTIHQRVLDLFTDRYPHPQELLNTRLPRLRKAGLSKQKAGYLKAIARFALEEGLDHKLLAKKSDDELLEYLTQIHGVGKWTVEMLLMFAFNRPDIFSPDDVGIQNAMRRLYRLDEEGKELKLRMQRLAEPWRPYRTIVCKYLWGWKAVEYRS